MSERSLHVLLVDDDEEDYLITRDLFEEIQDHDYDYVLEWIDDYTDAVHAIREHRHDVYLFDYHLGKRTGLELLAEAIACPTRAPIIMMTGQGARAVDLEAMELGAYDYLIKGQVTAQMLERSIRYALQHSASTEALRHTVSISSALLTVVNHLDRGVVITDPLLSDHPIIYVNDFFLTMTGYMRHEVLGRNARFLQGVEADPVEVLRMNTALQEGRTYRGEVRNERKDGTAFTNRLVIFPVMDNTSRLSKFVSICIAVHEV